MKSYFEEIQEASKKIGDIIKASDIHPEDAEFIVRAVNVYEQREIFLKKVSRSACLDQQLENKCICFSCEAKRLLEGN